MFRALGRIVIQLFLITVFLVLAGTTLIIHDGLSNVGTKADVAFVPGQTAFGMAPASVYQARLDEAISRYNLGQFPAIIVSGDPSTIADMGKYAASKGIPTTAILDNEAAPTMAETAARLAQMIKDHHFTSVMIVTNYYQVSRWKAAMWQAGITGIEQAHFDKAQIPDAPDVSSGMVAMLDDLDRAYVWPLKGEINDLAAKARQENDQLLSASEKPAVSSTTNIPSPSIVPPGTAPLPATAPSPDPLPTAPPVVSGFVAKFNNHLVTVGLDGSQQDFDASKLAGVKFWAFYYSASWCPPCRAFTPDLVSFYNGFKATHPDFELIFVNDDHNEADMISYMKGDGMSWPAVRYADINNPELEAKKYCGEGIPCLVLVGADGQVLSDTYQNGQYTDPHHVIDDIRTMVR